MLPGGLILAAVFTLVALAVPSFSAMKNPEVIYPGPGVRDVRPLSTYFAGLAGTPGDTDVYLLERNESAGGKSGGTALILGGTHADEPAGILAAVLLVERARVTAGRVFVIPHANASAATHTPPQEGYPRFFTIETPNGPRRFRYGFRLTNPLDQWPDPTIYVHASSGQTLSGSEVRNLNRAYPGRPDGTLTERIAYAITSLIKREQVDLVIDLHEASPEYPVINTIVAHEKATDLAAMVNLELQSAGIQIGLEPSPRNLHGLSHRELGDFTDAFAVLMETANPAQGRLRGRTDSRLVTTGKDGNYVEAAKAGHLFVPYGPDGIPLAERVARHVAGVEAFLRILGDFRPGRGIAVEGLPSYEELVREGVGRFLRAPRGGR